MASTTTEAAALRALEGGETLAAYIARNSPRFARIPGHLQKVVDVFQATREREVYATISMPPRHGKTETIAHGLGWRTERDPACLNFYATFGDALSQHTSRKTRKLVRHSGLPLFEQPLSADATAVHDWRTPYEGGLKATSVGGDVTGRGCNGGVIVADDIVKGRKQAESQKIRDDAWDWLTDDLMSRLEPGASLIVVGTRWHEDDPIGRIKSDSLGLNWIHIDIPALRLADGTAGDERKGEDVIPLWPENGYDLERYKRIRMRGEHGWWSLYQQQPTPKGGGMFKSEWFSGALVDSMPTAGRWVRSWDLAASTDRDSAFSAGSLVGLHNRALYVADVKRGQWGSEDRDRIILETAQLDGKSVEIRLPQDPGQAGKSQVAHFAKLLHGYVVHFEVESESKHLRADPYASQCAAGNVHALRGAKWLRAFVDEHTGFPGLKLKDQVDSMSGAYSILIRTAKSDGHFGGWSGA